MATIGERIENYRKKLELTRADLSRMTDIPEPLLYRYEHGISDNMTSKTITKLCNALNVNPADLLGWTEDDFGSEVCGFKIPVYEKLTGIDLKPVGKDPVGFVHVLDESISSKDDLFAFVHRGESLADDGILDGDIVVIKKQDELETNKLVAVAVKDGDVQLRKMIFTKTGMTLYSSDPSEAEQEYGYQDISDGRIQVAGKCIMVVRNLK